MSIIKIRHKPGDSMQGLSQNPPVTAGLFFPGVACLHDLFSISQRPCELFAMHAKKKL